MIMMPYFLMAQNNSPQKKDHKNLLKIKKNAYEYVIIRAVKETQSVANTDKTVSLKREARILKISQLPLKKALKIK